MSCLIIWFISSLPFSLLSFLSGSGLYPSCADTTSPWIFILKKIQKSAYSALVVISIFIELMTFQYSLELCFFRFLSRQIFWSVYFFCCMAYKIQTWNMCISSLLIYRMNFIITAKCMVLTWGWRFTKLYASLTCVKMSPFIKINYITLKSCVLSDELWQILYKTWKVLFYSWSGMKLPGLWSLIHSPSTARLWF